MLKIHFLGTGTSQGIPVIGSKHPVCLSSNPKDKRLRVSILIQWNDVNLVVDCGPDFRQQMLRVDCKTLDAILFTHEHADHTAGIDDIRPFFFKQGDIKVYSSKRVLDNLSKRFDYVFSNKNKYPGAPSVSINEIKAPFTFNSRKLVDDLIEARRTGSGHFPDFDHKERDPVEGRISLKPGKRIVIVEGNYLLLNEHPWNRLQSEVFDEGWFLHVTLEECKRRVLKRHHQVMKISREESMWRLMTNDGPNAELVIQESIGNADRLVEIRNHPSGDEVA